MLMWAGAAVAVLGMFILVTGGTAIGLVAIAVGAVLMLRDEG